MELPLPNPLISNLLLLFLRSVWKDMSRFLSAVYQGFSVGFCDNDVNFDHDHCHCQLDFGKMSFSQANEVMNRLGLVVDDHEGDGDGDGKGKLYEFATLLEDEEPSLEELREAFGVFDMNRDGYIDALELQRVVGELGLNKGIGLEEIRGMIRGLDRDGDELIDFTDFVKLMERCLC